MQSFAFQYSITQSTIIRVIEMNLSLEAYDWWATKIPTQYRTLASNFDSNSELFNGYFHINNKNGENFFDAYLKVWVLYFYIRARWTRASVIVRTSVHRTLILVD